MPPAGLPGQAAAGRVAWPVQAIAGAVRVVLKPLQGAERIARLFHVVARQLAVHDARLDYRPVLVNGELGLLRLFNGALHSVPAFETAGDRIVSISIVANPAKVSGAIARAPPGA